MGVHTEVQRALTAADRNHVTILNTAYGQPFTVAGFSQFMRDAIRAAGLPLDCKPHGLRKTLGRRMAMLVPAVVQALKTHDKVRLYYETASDFVGIDPGAMWEDFKVGMEHLTRWERVAVVTDVEWIKQTMRFFSFLMPGTMKLFPTSEATQAREWIAS
jgi:hypothetical protein